MIFKDCSQSSRVEVSVQEKSSKKTVKVTIDNHQYELKIPSTSGSQQAVIKVNGEEKTYIKKQDYEKRKQVEEEKQNREYQQASKQDISGSGWVKLKETPEREENLLGVTQILQRQVRI